MQEPRSELKQATARPAKSAESGAFEEIYLRFAPRLRRIAIAKFGVAPDDAEVLVQDVFATFFMHAAAVEHVERYLVGAICNASRKHLLKREGSPDLLFCETQPCVATPDDVLLRQLERKQLLSRVFARIGSRCRDLLCRYYLNGESTAAIAANLESTPGSVSVNLHKCRRRAVEAYRAITGAS